MILALTIDVLVGGGVYLIVQRGMVRAVFGLALDSHAVHLLLLASAVPGCRAAPLCHINGPGVSADPLPQASLLPAIVTTPAVPVYVLSLAVVGRADDTPEIPATGEEADW